jgi:hypothetical protein
MNTQEQARRLHRDADGPYLGEDFEDAAPAPAGAASSPPPLSRHSAAAAGFDDRLCVKYVILNRLPRPIAAAGHGPNPAGALGTLIMGTQVDHAFAETERRTERLLAVLRLLVLLVLAFVFWFVGGRLQGQATMMPLAGLTATTLGGATSAREWSTGLPMQANPRAPSGPRRRPSCSPTCAASPP